MRVRKYNCFFHSEEYRAIKKQTDPEIDRLLRQNSRTGVADYEYKKYIDFGLNIIQHTPHYYATGDLNLKQGLISSIFEEKIVFENKQCRTPKFNEAVSLICPEIRALEGNKKGTEGVFSLQSRMVPRGSNFSNFIEDFNRIRKLKAFMELKTV